jgi:rhamnosyltransferase
MKRYFDMGVFHSREPWIRQALGSAEGAGGMFVVSELKFLSKHTVWYLPVALLRTFLRYTGFRLGLVESGLPLWLKRWMAMNKGFFKK